MISQRFALLFAASVAGILVVGTTHPGVALNIDTESEPNITSTHTPTSNRFLLAQNTSYLSALEQGVIDEMNFARQNPQTYADLLEERRQYYNGNRIEYPGQIPLVTNEGVAALDEAIAFLRNAEPLPALTSSYGIHLASKDHVNDIGPTGATSHTGNDGSSFSDRMERYGSWQRNVGENIDFGNNDPREVVMSLIIDDGVPGRGHRENIFSPNFLVTGVACGDHAQYRSTCVIGYAGGFEETVAVPGNAPTSPSNTTTAQPVTTPTESPTEESMPKPEQTNQGEPERVEEDGQSEPEGNWDEWEPEGNWDEEW